jgi:hypothetical protein
MPRRDTGVKGAANEYPHVVEVLDVELNRRIIEFHKSRNIEPRHGRRIFRDGENFFRWCFSDLATARAFVEQFGGEVHKSRDQL